MSAKRTKDMLTVAVLLAAAAAAIHFYVDNMARNAAWHALYPLRAKLALSKLSCSPGSPAWMEDALRLSVERQVAPANQIAYIDAQGREFHCENGFFDKPYLSDAVTEQTRFRYASMTKLWTADAVLALVNENKIGLDTKAVDILPEIRNQTDPRMNDITVAHLLLHQGGFDRYSMLGIDMFNPNEEPLCPNHLAELGTIRLNFTPGSRTSYSNLGYCLLGEIVARKSGGGTYTEAMGRLYPLAQDGLKFIRQQQESDEVSYNYVEKGLTGLADIYSSFDYAAAASAAGLSGSALGAAKEIRAMLAREKLNARLLRLCHVSLSGKRPLFGLVSRRQSARRLFRGHGRRRRRCHRAAGLGLGGISRRGGRRNQTFYLPQQILSGRPDGRRMLMRKSV